MSVWRNIWRHKTILLTALYTLLEVIITTFDLPVNRKSWWYLTLVLALILCLVLTAITAVTQEKMPTT